MSTESQQKQPSLVLHALKWGMFLGALMIVLAFLLLEINYKLIADIKTGLLVILLVLGFTIYGGINFRNKSGGALSYGDSYQHGIAMMAVGGFIYSIYNLLLYTVIAPELPGKLIEVSIQKEEAELSEDGKEIIDSAVESARKSGAAKFSISGVLTGYPIVLIFYAVCALITALFVRKSKPEFT
jgi:hypothetical protein